MNHNKTCEIYFLFFHQFVLILLLEKPSLWRNSTHIFLSDMLFHWNSEAIFHILGNNRKNNILKVVYWNDAYLSKTNLTNYFYSNIIKWWNVNSPSFKSPSWNWLKIFYGSSNITGTSGVRPVIESINSLLTSMEFNYLKKKGCLIWYLKIS